jgi:hypothetical protein
VTLLTDRGESCMRAGVEARPYKFQVDNRK